MSIVVLDINDSSLGLWRDEECILSSPGYALLEGQDYNFGEEAKAQARLRPRQINHRFWSQLDTEPLNPRFGPGRHSADLVHAHLLALYEAGGRPEELVIAAPANLQHEQLSLLLGIIGQCPFEAIGLVDRAVAATSQSPVSDYNWHVELQLNKALLTGMRFVDGALQRDASVPVPGSGWLAVMDSLAKAVADAFIRQTRFDPRRSAATEQELYNQLPQLLQKLKSHAESNMELGGNQARIERSLLAESCANHYQRILRTVTSDSAQVFLGAALDTLPDITAHLPQAVSSESGTVAAGTCKHIDTIRGGSSGVHFITSLPAQGPSVRAAVKQAIEPTPEPAAAAPAAAEPIDPGRCQIEIEGQQARIKPLSGPAIQIDGEVLTETRNLLGGELITLADGSAWRLVEANPEDGTQA